MSQSTTNPTTLEEAMTEIHELKFHNMQLKHHLELTRKQTETAIQRSNEASMELYAANHKKAEQDVTIAELQQSSDNARRAYVELQYKIDMEKMPLYAVTMEGDEVDEAIDRELNGGS
ncbi:hypothetical protein M409DRAFT_22162 [Zasmidium cellare ATCC 36951]|uniref:Uncharacterized protein n=1 Tax=Zasmidium cellare ATCC 36951 TaxID=1080233 RepID=A0A6A6CN57_ZASCE|nr:uncharacterized protein M409DRAFT_22162 [Zasmidium cellare ATCC 36951]KAF2167352.1 hypothetical protein M409DRAFT_22162 [Zasmidium cellare ATCC 36951]